MIYLLQIILQLIFLLILLYTHLCLAKVSVTARCHRPGIPPKSHLKGISVERNRFDNKKIVDFVCEENVFPLLGQTKECQNGKWVGKKVRCGNSTEAKLIHFEIRDCSTNTMLVSQEINQIENKPNCEISYPSSYHPCRVDEDKITTSANGSNCYNWYLSLDRNQTIYFVIINIYSTFNKSAETAIPDLILNVGQQRSCVLDKTKQRKIHDTLDSHILLEVITYFYFCSLKSEQGSYNRLTDMTDKIRVQIKNKYAKELGLGPLYIGDIYRKFYINSKYMKPDCGQIELQSTAINFSYEGEHTYISCNDSFIDYSKFTNKTQYGPNYIRHRFDCNSNGEWVGQWPVCAPIITCPKREIIKDINTSIRIEEIGNVYYLNSSHWFAINDSWVRYGCLKDNDIMIGKPIRTCQSDGKWSDRQPNCTGTGLSGIAISVILIAILITFGLIVFIGFYIQSKKVRKELNQTKEKIEKTKQEIIETKKQIFAEESYDYLNLETENNYETDFKQSCVMYDDIRCEPINSLPVYETMEIK